MRWIKIGFIFSLIGLGFGVISLEVSLISCCGGLSLIFGLLYWSRNNTEPKQIQHDITIPKPYQTPSASITITTNADRFVEDAKLLEQKQVADAIRGRLQVKALDISTKSLIERQVENSSLETIADDTREASAIDVARQKLLALLHQHYVQNLDGAKVDSEEPSAGSTYFYDMAERSKKRTSREELLPFLRQNDVPSAVEVELTAPERQEKSVGIPSRQQAHKKQQAETADKSLQNLYSKGYFWKTGFVTAAKQLVDRVENSAEFTPFHAYYSRYSDMSLAQLQWYFYWRGQIRQGNYPKTDTSYLFVHIYELLQNVGVTDVDDGYRQLMALWHAYDSTHKIGRYLVNWVSDYLILNKPRIDRLDFYRQPLPQKHTNSEDAKLLLLNAMLSDPKAILPAEVLLTFVEYSIVRNKLGRAGYGEWYNEQMAQAVGVLDQQLKTVQGKGIYDRFRPKKTLTVRRRAYQSVPDAYGQKEITFTGLYNFTKSQRLQKELNNIVGYIDAQLVEKLDLRLATPKLKLKATWRAILNRALEGVTFSAEKLPISSKIASQMDGSQKARYQMIKKGASRKRGSRKQVVIENRWGLNFGELSSPEAAWYVHWRNQARKGDFITYDAACIILYAQELVNQLGVKNAPEGYAALLALWRYCGGVDEKLAAKLGDWILGYLTVNECGVTMQEHLLLPEHSVLAIERVPDLLLNSAEFDFATMPIELFDAISDHKIRKSSFYVGENAALLRRYLPQAVAQIDRYARQKSGQGLLERFTPPKGILLSLESCWWAYYANWPQQIALTDVRGYSQQRTFCKLMTGIVKHTENYFRQRAGVRGRLRGGELSADIKRVLDAWLPTIDSAENSQKSTKTITIDPERLAQLKAESEAVFELLSLEESEPIAKAAEPSKLTVAIDPQRLAQLEMESEAVFEMLHVEEEVESADFAPLQPAPQPMQPTPQIDDANEWQQLMAQLQPAHLEILTITLAQPDDAIARIHALATQNGTMPSLLVDTINEHAQDIIGDLLIELNPHPQFIDDYYIEQLEPLLRR